jgi:outer membrane cobalamin receptor
LAPAAGQRASDSAQTVGTVTIAASRAPTVVGGAGAVAARVDSLHTPPAPTLDVALRRLPFVLVRTNSRGETELSVRGSESRTPTVLLDGLPLSLGWNSRSDPSLIPLSGVAAIRVSRSAGSLLAGPNAVGSVLELDFARAAVPKRELRLATGVDHLGTTVFSATIGAPVARQSGTLAFRAGASSRNRPALARAEHR